MFCPNCGKQLPDDSTFCEHCGTKIEAEQPKAAPSAPAQSPVQPSVQAPVPSQPAQPSPLTEFVKKNKKMVGIGAGVLVLLIAVVAFIATRPQKVKLEDYVSVTFSGYDTWAMPLIHLMSRLSARICWKDRVSDPGPG